MSRLYCHELEQLKIIDPAFEWEKHVDVFLTTTIEIAFEELLATPPPWKIVCRTEKEAEHWKWFVEYQPEEIFERITVEVLPVEPIDWEKRFEKTFPQDTE